MLGLAIGTTWPGIGPAMETWLWPTLAALLFATFRQVPLLHVRDALRVDPDHLSQSSRQAASSNGQLTVTTPELRRTSTEIAVIFDAPREGAQS